MLAVNRQRIFIFIFETWIKKNCNYRCIYMESHEQGVPVRFGLQSTAPLTRTKRSRRSDAVTSPGSFSWASCGEFSSIAPRESMFLWLDAFGRRKNRHLYFGKQPAKDEILAGFFFFIRLCEAFVYSERLLSCWYDAERSNPSLGCNNRRWRRNNRRSRCKSIFWRLQKVPISPYCEIWSKTA